ncbi:MAG: (5-formylfuran-3-yl)methyl phosphate synthase [Aureliella sp.]
MPTPTQSASASTFSNAQGAASPQRSDSTGNDRERGSGSPALLVSVRDAREAKLALASGVDWIDLKNPAAGALGAPSVENLRDVGNVLRNHPYRSVALGELADWSNAKQTLAPSVMNAGFPVAKFGLAGMASRGQLRGALVAASEDLGPTVDLVPVIYGDYAQCDAPAPDAVLDSALAIDSSYVLIDTHEKNGKSLLDWMTVSDVERIVHRASKAGVKTVVAGSIRLEHLSDLIHAGAFAIGIRGAVCSGDRADGMCSEKLAEWTQRFGSA